MSMLLPFGDHDAITTALGEIRDIWPARILPDAFDSEAAARKLDWRRRTRGN
jgi:hypothetical protein